MLGELSLLTQPQGKQPFVSYPQQRGKEGMVGRVLFSERRGHVHLNASHYLQPSPLWAYADRSWSNSSVAKRACCSRALRPCWKAHNHL